MKIRFLSKGIGWACLVFLTLSFLAPAVDAQRRGGGPPPGMTRGPSSRGGDRGSPPPSGPMSFISRLDRNGNGMIDPDEMQGRTRMMFERMAGEAHLDMSRPIPLEAIGRAFEEMRNRRMREQSGDSRSSSSDRGRSGSDRGRDRGSSRSAAPDSGYEPLVAGFGEVDMFDAVPGFGDAGERFAVKITDADRQEAARMMARNDGNKDGVLDKEEIRRDRWRDDALMTDRNRDGKLTLNELALRYAMRRTQKEGSSSSSSQRSTSRSTSSRGSSSSSRDSGSGDRQNRMVVFMFGRYDRNKNGVIDGDEFKSMRGGGERYDLNKDGKVTRDEMAKAMGDRFGGRSGGESGGRFYSRRGDRSRGDEKKDKSASSSSSDGRRSFRSRTAADRLADYEELPEWFARSDANADGQVEMSEYASSWSDTVVADFAQFDLNGDGIVTPAECMKAVERGAVQGAAPATASSSTPASSTAASSRASSPSVRPTSSVATRREPATPSVAASSQRATASAGPGNVSGRYIKFAVGVIKRYDANKDGVLTADEWKSMPNDYSYADSDKDGRLTPVELGAAYQSPK